MQLNIAAALMLGSTAFAFVAPRFTVDGAPLVARQCEAAGTRICGQPGMCNVGGGACCSGSASGAGGCCVICN
ncbi:hypothetical protein BST61_g11435 [Cercospora zeina]